MKTLAPTKCEFKNDNVLSKVSACIEKNDWPSHNKSSREFNAFFNIHNELFIEEVKEKKILKLSHQSLFGIEKLE